MATLQQIHAEAETEIDAFFHGNYDLDISPELFQDGVVVLYEATVTVRLGPRV